jgi:F0F1-type ATP synthase epsilon subunit
MSVYDIKTTSSIFKKTAYKVVLPGVDGQLSVWDFHQAMVVSLKKGKISIDEKEYIFIEEGVAKMQSNELVLMVIQSEQKK